MSLHKLTAGDGYTYLTRQVAVHDRTDRGHASLGDYYAEKGESPGRWWGAGLAGLDLPSGVLVTEQQMQNLFGQGRHPHAQELEAAAAAAGASERECHRAGALGRAFPVSHGAPGLVREVAQRLTAYNTERGQHWQAPVPPEVRSRIRTEVTNELFRAQHGRDPVDERERAGYLARESRQQTRAVAGYDLTFTPVKSVSALWALADREQALGIGRAHEAAVTGTLSWLEAEGLFTRRGRGGIQQVPARGLVAAMFVHRDARSGDPNLHSHVAISNKVQDARGDWLAVDGRALYRLNVTLSERYNTLLEAELTRRLGLHFEERPTTLIARHEDADTEKRAVREVVGVDPDLLAAWSKRSVLIAARQRDLTQTFQAEHGRPPTTGESIALAQRANLETRQAKHQPRSEAEQRSAWRAEATAVLGGEAAVDRMVTEAFHPRIRRPRLPSARTLSRRQARELAKSVVRTVESDRATWHDWHLRAEALRRARGLQLNAEDIDRVVDRVVRTALRSCVAFTDPDPLVAAGQAPGALTRPDGESVYLEHRATRYTSRRILRAEARILEIAHQGGGRRASDADVDVALARAHADGAPLTTAQEQMVRQMATSGKRLEMALAPAGTGKTTALAALCDAWRTSGGEVVGLAPSAVAAKQLGDALTTIETRGHRAHPSGEAVVSDTLSKLVHSITVAAESPAWVTGIGQGTLLLIDEAGMAATTELAAGIQYAVGKGASVRLIGDDRQLGSVQAGGILRDLAQMGDHTTLSEVHRFHDPAEAAATLALREGDPAALAFYADHQRIHVGDLTTCADQAYRAWAADQTADKATILLAPTRTLVAELNERARRDRLESARLHHDPGGTERQPEVGIEVDLHDGTRASCGDLVITRHNDRSLRTGPTDWVKNGDRWAIRHVHPNGTLTLQREGCTATVRLPATYVTNHVQLGYATTIHGAQGLTVDTAHTVLTGQEDRALLYVGATRGRIGNHLYVPVTGDGDPHSIIRPEALLPPTALDILSSVLARDTSPVSATTAIRQTHDPDQVLANATARYVDALGTAAHDVLGETWTSDLDRVADRLVLDLTAASAWPTLRARLALHDLDENPGRPTSPQLLASAVRLGPLTDVHDAAAVLHARVDALVDGESLGAGPLPWLPDMPANLARHESWGPYLAQRSDQVAAGATVIEQQAAGWTEATAPTWALPYLSPTHRQILSQIAIWRAAQRIPDTDPRPTGEPAWGRPGAYQRHLDRTIHAIRPHYPASRRHWFDRLPAAVINDPWIGHLCQRLSAIEAAGLQVTDHLDAALPGSETGSARPLPDEQPAAALWWRIVPHLGPAALQTSRGAQLRPTWLPALAALTGEPRARFLQGTPAWPSLVAAVDDACRRHQWRPETILSAALDAIPEDQPVTGHQVAALLVMRIAALTDPALPPPLLPRDEPTDEVEPVVAATKTDDPTASVIRRWIRDVDQVAQQDRDATLEPAASYSRLTDLNAAALAYYSDLHPASWTSDYLRRRLGTDLIGHPSIRVGYAPLGPRSLLRHLTTSGADVADLLDAGLVRERTRSDGTTEYVDVFRDRLVLPIRDPHHPERVLGFVGRRNPTKTDGDYRGPKYLNTKGTAVFTKGHVLYGVAEHAARLHAGARVVIGEGPLDAIAITLASSDTQGHDAVGVAPLGTALTEAQAHLLEPYLIAEPTRVVVATDADPAGRRAAHAAYWRLTALDADPAVLALPDGLDPASVLENQGHHALHRLIAAAPPLADRLVDELISPQDWSVPGTHERVTKKAAAILAARPAITWPAAAEHVRERLHLPPGTVERLILEASIQRATDADRFARQHASLDSQPVPAHHPRGHESSTHPTPREGATITSPSTSPRIDVAPRP